MARARFTVTTTLRSNRLPQVVAAIQRNTRTAVDSAAAGVQQRASQVAPRDTGSLAESIYVNNGDVSDYSLRTATAQGLNRDVVILEEIRPEFVISLSGGNESSFAAVVGVAAGHGIFQEFGTRHSSPQSFMLPAVLGLEAEFINSMSHVADT
jgi:HK97 gp10 family phage protein